MADQWKHKDTNPPWFLREIFHNKHWKSVFSCSDAIGEEKSMLLQRMANKRSKTMIQQTKKSENSTKMWQTNGSKKTLTHLGCWQGLLTVIITTLFVVLVTCKKAVFLPVCQVIFAVNNEEHGLRTNQRTERERERERGGGGGGERERDCLLISKAYRGSK